MPELASRVVDELTRSGRPLDDDELAARLAVVRQAVNQACRRMAEDGRIGRGAGPEGKIVNWSVGRDVTARPNPMGPVGARGISSGREFEDHAREVLSHDWGLALSSRVLTLRGGVTHSFDLVSADAGVVGDAKWFKDLQPIPAAKLSVIAEYVWLLQNLDGAQRCFLVFGQDRAVPERWLSRFRPLLAGVEFRFLDDSLTRLA